MYFLNLTVPLCCIIYFQDEKSSREANEALITNATNLMDTIKEAVNAAKAASIKIRTDSGHKIEWRRNPKPRFY